MSRSRILKAVLSNVLGTLLSRHSSSGGGFWLLGLAESELEGWRSDLLLDPLDAKARAAPIEELRSLAARRFREQLLKAVMDIASIARAEIWVASASGPVMGWAGETQRRGRVFRFAASATTIKGAQCGAEGSVFVAPHDAGTERSNPRPPAPN